MGKRALLYCTALGKVLLICIPEEERKEILGRKRLPRLTEKTITDEKKLEKELDRVKKQGFALDLEENEKDICCIATTIKIHQGEVIAAISISGPAFRIDVNK